MPSLTSSLPDAAASICAPERELHEQGNRAARRAFLAAALPCGTRYVEVGPVVLCGVAGQEAGCGDTACGPAADVGHVGEVGLELFLVIVPKRHGPGAVPGFVSRRDQFARKAFIVGVKPAGHMSECDHAGAGECGDVHDGCGLKAFRVGQRVAKYQPAFGIGVEDLDGLPREARHHIAGFGCRAAGHILTGRYHADDVGAKFHLRDGAQRAQYAGGAAHVELHLVHFRRRLERNASGVKGDALAYQNNRLLLFGAAVITQDDHLGWLA